MNKKKFLLYLKLFIPPILYPIKLREILNRILKRKKTIHHYEYEKKFYSRHAFINKAVSNYDNCKYLEIGVANNQVFNSIPLKRLGKANEVAELAYFLTTDEGSYITGQTISIDGGLFMY